MVKIRKNAKGAYIRRAAAWFAVFLAASALTACGPAREEAAAVAEETQESAAPSEQPLEKETQAQMEGEAAAVEGNDGRTAS